MELKEAKIPFYDILSDMRKLQNSSCHDQSLASVRKRTNLGPVV